MTITSGCSVPGDDVTSLLRGLVDAHSVASAALSLGVCPEVVMRALGGLPIRAGSMALIRAALGLPPQVRSGRPAAAMRRAPAVHPAIDAPPIETLISRRAQP